MKGDWRIVVVCGSRIHMEHDGHQWWNVRVAAVESFLTHNQDTKSHVK
jgi:hypothetical protein